MGKSTPSPPPAPQQPDPAAMARAQGEMNFDTAKGQSAMNMVNQVTPYGSVTYQPTGLFHVAEGKDVPTWTATQTLSPEQQRIYDSQQQISQGTLDLGNAYVKRIGDATASPFSYDGLPSSPTYDENFRKQQIANIQARAQPMMDRQRAQLEQMLADRGVGIQDPAYRTAMDQYQRGVNDFQLGADAQAGQESQNAFNLAATTRDRAIQERANLRSQPINEVSALLGLGSNGVRGPEFVSTPQTQIANTDTYAPYAIQNANYAQQSQNAMMQQQMAMQQQNAMLGGLFGLGSSAIMGGMMRSDIRVKRDIRHVGYTSDGQRLYLFRYNDGDDLHLGLMAQEVERIKPHAVVEIDGIKHVDIVKALA